VTPDERRGLLVQSAYRWLGTPYHHRARIHGVGVDCAQLLIAVYAEAGVIDAFEPEDYPMDWMLHREEERFIATIRACGGVRTNNPRPGDVALWRFGRCYAHGGILVGDGLVIHARNPMGVLLSGINEGELARRHCLYWTVQ